MTKEEKKIKKQKRKEERMAKKLAKKEEKRIAKLKKKSLYVEQNEIKETPQAQLEPQEEQLEPQEEQTETKETQTTTETEETQEKEQEEPFETEQTEESEPTPENKQNQKRKTAKQYHISLRVDNKWQLKFGGSSKALKLFNTQKEAIEYAKPLALKQKATLVIHKVDGKIRKQDYNKK